MTRTSRPRTSRNSVRHRALTLIELMVVLAIWSICLWVVGVSLQPAADQARLDAVAQELGAVLAFAAEENGRPSPAAYTVVYDLDRQQYWLEKPETPRVDEALTAGTPAPMFKHFLRPGAEIARVWIAGADESVTHGRVALSLTAGRPENTHLVYLRGPAGRRLTVEVLPVSAEVYVHEGDYAYDTDRS